MPIVSMLLDAKGGNLVWGGLHHIEKDKGSQEGKTMQAGGKR